MYTSAQKHSGDAQYTAVVMFVVVNLYLVAAHCRWFQAGIIAAGVLQWSCVNTMFLVIWVRSLGVTPGIAMQLIAAHALSMTLT